jgi:hypothetical protein
MSGWGWVRGPRNNQFVIRIKRNGQAIPSVPAMDLGGGVFLETLRPGESVELRTPLSSWADISNRGTYIAEAEFRTVFYSMVKESENPGWDLIRSGIVAFEIP